MSEGFEPRQPAEQVPAGTPPSNDDPANRRPEGKSTGLARLPWAIAWACSVVVAFLLGTQSTGAPRPSAAPTSPGASVVETATQATPSGGAETVEPDVAEMLRKLPRRDPNDVAAKGRPDAKVTLVEWSDYRCPYCATWHTQTLPKMQEYIDNGTLRIEYRDYPIFGDQSVDTAIAARAAGKQAKFWEFQDAVFSAAPKSGHPDIPRTRIIEFATQAGVPDIARFEADLADPRIKEAINADAGQARDLGIGGTPFFVINDGYINGARPSSDFIRAVESAAKG